MTATLSATHSLAPRAPIPGPARAPSRTTLLPAPGIPSAPTQRAQWVCWHYGARQANGKRKKLMISPLRVNLPSDERYKQWEQNLATFDQALAEAKKHGGGWGVAYVVTKDDPYAFIDFDNCIVDGQLVRPDVVRWVELFGSYTERSASGTGLHIICVGSVAHALLSERAKLAGVECYDDKRACCFTGDVWEGRSAITHGIDALDALYAAYEDEPGTAIGSTSSTRTTPAGFVDGDAAERAAAALEHLAQWRVDSYTPWIKVGMALAELGAGGLALWDEWSRGSSKWLEGDCAKRWRHIRQKGGIGLGSLFEWAEADSGRTWTVSGWWADKRRREAAERARAAAPAAIVADAPSTAEALPWALTVDDWRSCPLCSAVHHHAKHAGDAWQFVIAHHWCHKRSCQIWQKVRAADVLEDLQGWPHIYTGVVDEGDRRRVRDQVHRAGGAALPIPQADGTVLMLANVAVGGLVEAVDRRVALVEAYAAVCASPAGKRVRLSTGARQQRSVDEDHDQNEVQGWGDPGAFAALERHQRQAVLSVEAAELRTPTADQALARILKITVGGEYADALRGLWRDVGLDVRGRRATGTADQARALADRLQELRTEIAREGTRRLLHIDPLNHYASNDDTLVLPDGRQVNRETGEITAVRNLRRPVGDDRATSVAEGGGMAPHAGDMTSEFAGEGQ